MTRENIEKADQFIMATYKRQPIVLKKGSGCTVWDDEGRTYIDFVAGIAVCNLGHVHPRVSRALTVQSEALFHVSNLYYTIPQMELAEYLVAHSFADKAFFCNSGAEANEAAIKLARRYFSEKNQKDRFRIITMEKSFHGRTMATLSATGQNKIKKGFDPVLDGFDFVPFNDPEALRKRVTPSVCAVMLEPIQGEGGVRCPDAGYLQAVRKICDEAGILLIFDEIQTGIGRTGKLFAYEHFGVEPDIMTLAKALANGLPIGAMLATDDVAQAFGPGSHATTFGGTPIITSAALETLRTIHDEKVLEHCTDVGEYFKNQLIRLKEKYGMIKDIRGMGLLLAVELSKDGNGIVDACREKGFLINCIQDTILRFAPPLIIEKDQIDSLVNCLDTLFAKEG